MSTSITTLRLPTALRDELDALAEATGRSKNYLMQQAIEEFVAAQRWQLARTQRALDDVRAGRRGVPLTEAIKRSIATGQMTQDDLDAARAEVARTLEP
jgi:predicted transcriptional regulator